MVNIFGVRINEKEKNSSTKRKQNKKDYVLFLPFAALQIIFLLFIILEHVNSGLRIIINRTKNKKQ
jgi:hypothetical protein